MSSKNTLAAGMAPAYSPFLPPLYLPTFLPEAVPALPSPGLWTTDFSHRNSCYRLVLVIEAR